MKLRKWVKKVLILMALVVMLLFLRKIQKSFIEDCVKAGYSMNYCIEHS